MDGIFTNFIFQCEFSNEPCYILDFQQFKYELLQTVFDENCLLIALFQNMFVVIFASIFIQGKNTFDWNEKLWSCDLLDTYIQTCQYLVLQMKVSTRM